MGQIGVVICRPPVVGLLSECVRHCTIVGCRPTVFGLVEQVLRRSVDNGVNNGKMPALLVTIACTRYSLPLGKSLFGIDHHTVHGPK